MHRILLITALVLGVSPLAAADWTLQQMVERDAQGRPVYRGRPVPATLRNPTSAEDEQSFQERARAVIAAQGQQKVAAGNTYFENEKRTYGYLMAQVLAGRAEAARDLQLEDAQAREWHRDTEGIDFFACFTIKHQTRKFFYFGELLEPAYRERMLRGAKAWTAEDPLRRPHFAFKGAGEGWGPDQKNSWVDVRSTENLYLMRVTSVYLFAEAAGNRAVQAKYKDELRRYTQTLFRVGMGEWDSENYLGHSMAPLCNLYDFAQDEQVRLWAKACLDWTYAAGAVKYYRGAFNGPSKRDYNHAQPFGGSAANLLWLHFGDAPPKTSDWESDEVHVITSAYRPPPAVLNLARKKFERPVQIIASKPPYSATTSGTSDAAPEYAETHYFGHSFQMGSLKSGTSEDGGDVNGFKLVMFSRERGADCLQGVPGPDPAFVGSPQYQRGKVSGPNFVAQDRNLATWLVRDGKSPWRWVVPRAVKVHRHGDVTLLEGERTWVAMRALGTTPIEHDANATQTVTNGEKPRFPGHQVLAATGQSMGYCGVAVEVGEPETHGDFAGFRQAVLKAQVDESKLAEGIAQYKSADGKWLGIHIAPNSADLGVWRNGQRHDWTRHAGFMYGRLDTEDPAAPIYSKWRSGTLQVEAGGERFTATVADDGATTFANEKVGGR